MSGVGCPVALDIADRCLAAAHAGQTQGSHNTWVSGDWTCVGLLLPKDAFVPNCTRSTDNGVVRLANHW